MVSLDRISGEGLASAQARIAGTFFLHSVVVAMLSMRLPDMQVAAGLSDGDLGFVLTGGAVGAFVSFLFGSRMIEGIGTRRTMLLTLPLMALGAALVSSTQSGALMFAWLFLNGAMASVAAIVINVEADRFEAATGTRIMNRCHGVWSVGFFLASSLAGVLRSLHVDPGLHLWGLFLVFTVATMAVVWPITEFAPRAFAAAGKRSRFAMPTLAVVILAAFGLGAELLDGALRIWSTIFVRDSFDVSTIIESMALPALVLSGATSRLFADGLIARYGSRRMAVIALCVAILGLALVVLSPHALVAIVGFAIVGAGTATIYPQMLSAAAKLGDRPASENVASATLVVQFVMLIAPVLVGSLAEAAGIRVALASILPLLVLGLVASRALR